MQACRNNGKIPGIAGRSIQDALNRRWSEIGLLTSVISMAPKHLEVLVTFDDGRLQRDLDATYGPGVVLVRSALRPLAKG